MSNASLHAPARPVATTVAPAVDIRSLSKSYGDVHAVRSLDLTIGPGEIVAILGPNGAGKSTTNELILGMIKPDAGSVRVFGQAPVRAVRSGQVGAMLQAGALLQEASVQDVLRLMHGLHAHPLPFAEIIQRADLAGFLATKTDKLSGGQAQRLRYGLAIMPDPDLLILDEPTVGMDVGIRRSFWASMREFTATGRTVLFATHYLDEADAVADRIAVLIGGRLVADGSGAQIKARVAGRTIAVATTGLDQAAVAALPGVRETEIVGSRLLVHAADSDAALRDLLRAFPQARDVEVTAAKLEDAFLALTAMQQS